MPRSLPLHVDGAAAEGEVAAGGSVSRLSGYIGAYADAARICVEADRPRSHVETTHVEVRGVCLECAAKDKAIIKAARKKEATS